MNTPDLRNESVREQVATIIQTGHIAKRTSMEVAEDIEAFLYPQECGDQDCACKHTD